MSDEVKPVKKKKAPSTAFSTKKKTLDITIDDVPHIVVQLSGLEKEEWEDEQRKRYEFDFENEKTILRDSKGQLWDFVRRCVFKKTDESTRVPLQKDQVDLWSAECLEGLYDVCREVNGLKVEEAEEEVKKD